MNQCHRSSDNQVSSRDKTVVRILAVIFLIGGFQVATQYFAHQFNYQDQLGSHFNQLYAPWSIVTWSIQWYDKHPGIFDLAAGYGILFSSVGLILVLIVKMMLANSSRANRNLYGSARWADKKDIEAAGLLSSKKNKSGEAVYVGAWRDRSGKTHYLKHSDPEHVLCFAPTRSGKGVSLVIPTLLSWTQSTVITDLKGELLALTAGWRKHYANNDVLRFDPASTASCHWNPLDEIIIGSGTEVADVQNLVNLIVDPDGKGLETHWQKTAHALLVGLILHVLHKSQRDGTPAILPAVDALLSDPDRDIRELWMEMIMPENGDTHPATQAGAANIKGGGGLFRERNEVMYSFITQKKKTCPVGLLCRLLGVSRSAYYAYEQRCRNGPDDLRHRQLLVAVQNITKSCDYTYGSRRMKRALNALGYQVSRWKARRLMQEAGIQVRHRKKYKVTTDSNHPLPVFENQLNRQFTVARPDQVYVCDITYIWTQEGWLYLAVVIDLFSRKVVGWSMSSRMKAVLVCDALRMAIWLRRPPPGLIVHLLATNRIVRFCSK